MNQAKQKIIYNMTIKNIDIKNKCYVHNNK